MFNSPFWRWEFGHEVAYSAGPRKLHDPNLIPRTPVNVERENWLMQPLYHTHRITSYFLLSLCICNLSLSLSFFVTGSVTLGEISSPEPPFLHLFKWEGDSYLVELMQESSLDWSTHRYWSVQGDFRLPRSSSWWRGWLNHQARRLLDNWMGNAFYPPRNEGAGRQPITSLLQMDQMLFWRWEKTFFWHQ